MYVYVCVCVCVGGNQPKLTREERKCIYHLRPFNSNIFFVSCKKWVAEVKTATESCCTGQSNFNVGFLGARREAMTQLTFSTRIDWG